MEEDGYSRDSLEKITLMLSNISLQKTLTENEDKEDSWINTFLKKKG